MHVAFGVFAGVFLQVRLRIAPLQTIYQFTIQGLTAEKNEIRNPESVIHFANIPSLFSHHGVLHRGSEPADSVGESKSCGGIDFNGTECPTEAGAEKGVTPFSRPHT